MHPSQPVHQPIHSDVEAALYDIEDEMISVRRCAERTEQAVRDLITIALAIQKRLTRVESRLCQFMEDQGSDVYLEGKHGLD